jgi:hypothetical protein
MALTLAEAAKYSQNSLQRGVLETIIMNGVVLDRIPFLTVEGNAYAYNKETTLPGVEFRAVNSAYTESTGVINQATESLVIMGGEADVDTFLVRTRGNLNDLRAEQTAMKAKSINFKYQDAFINGDTAVDANSFDGLKKRLTGAQVIAAGTNGLSVIGADDAARHLFLDQLDKLIAAVVPGPARCALHERDDPCRDAEFRSPADDLRPNDRSVWPPGHDLQRRSRSWISAYKSDFTTMILPQTETQGTSNITSSIYAVKYGGNETERAVTGLQNGGVDVRDLGEQQAKPVFRTRIEWFTGLAVFGTGAARLTGVLP